MSGYVLAYRKAWYHPLFKDFRDAAIWNFLYQNAFWQPGQKTFNGQTFDLQRGQIVVSISYLAKGFHMSEKEIRGAIRRLAEGEMVGIQGAGKGSIITICNYDKYQCFEKTEGEQKADIGLAEVQAQGDNKKQVNKKTRKQKTGQRLQPFLESVGIVCGKIDEIEWPDEWVDFAAKEFPDLPRKEIFTQLETMLDWSKTSKNGAKDDWMATWRNWIRRSAPDILLRLKREAIYGQKK